MVKLAAGAGATLVMLACATSNGASESPPDLRAVSAAEGSATMQFVFYCSRAADSDAVLSATAGPGATHAQAVSECDKQISLTVDSVRKNRSAVSSFHWKSTRSETATQVLADLDRVDQLLNESKTALARDDRDGLRVAVSKLGDAEGKVEFDEAHLGG